MVFENGLKNIQATAYNGARTVCTVDKTKVEISQNFVAFSEYMNFTKI